MLPPIEGHELLDELMAKKVEIKARRQTDGTGLLLMVYLGVTVLLVVGMWMMFRRARDQFMGGGILSGFSKSPAKRYESATSRSRSPTSPAWKASRTTCKKSSSS